MEKLKPLAILLRSLNPTVALTALQEYCCRTPLSQARSTVSKLPEPARSILAVGTHDILSGYPFVIFAAPILLYFRSSTAALPAPAQPPFGEYISLRQALGPTPTSGKTVLSNRIQVGLVVIRGDDTEPPSLPDDWCLSLYPDIPSGSTLHIAGGGPMLPWPQAVEAAQTMYSTGISGKAERNENVWLGDVDWQRALDRALLFRRMIAAAIHGAEPGVHLVAPVEAG